MGNVYEGSLEVGADWKVALVASRFNDFITEHLIDGAKDAFIRHGGKEGNLDVFRVPGSFEIPPVAKRLAESGKYRAVVCLGAVIRGATPHFEYIAQQAARGIAEASLRSPVPVSFGVLTTDTIEQAVERAGTKAGNKGFDAMLAAVEMVNLFDSLPS